MRFSPISSVVLSIIFYYILDYIWVSHGLVTGAHSFPSQDLGGVLGLLILP